MGENQAPLDIAQLVADHHQVLYRYAYRLTGSTADGEDLTQQAFLIAQQKLDQLRAADCARSWLFTILRNCYLKGFRRPGPVTAASLNLDMDRIPAKEVDSPIDSERLQAVLNELPDDFRLVVLLYYFEERSYREIAQSLDIPLGTVMSRLSRAKGYLRQRLSEPQRLWQPITPNCNGQDNGPVTGEQPAFFRH